MSEEFRFIERPLTRNKSGFSEALRKTLTDGTAIAFPLNGETYAVLRNRKAATASQVARKVNACVRTVKADDGGLLIWLAAKEQVPR